MGGDVLVLCINPDWKHLYGVLSGEPMAYYLYARRNKGRVFFSTKQPPWGDLQKEEEIKYGYIYDRGRIGWFFRLLKVYKSLEEIPPPESAYIPPFRRGYRRHKRWYLLTDVKKLKERFVDKISSYVTENRIRYLTNFQYVVRSSGKTRKLRTSHLNAAICKSTFSLPEMENFQAIDDPISHIIRTDLRESKLRESTIERAFVLKLLVRGNYPVEGRLEEIDWLAEQPVLREKRDLT